MSIQVNVSLSFMKQQGSEKVIFGRNVVNSIGTVAAQFPNLPFSLQALLATTDELASAELAALSGDTTASQHLKAVRKRWNTAFKTTAAYVSMIAQGNVQTIVEAGFSPTKNFRQKTAKIISLEGFNVVVNPAKGTAKAQCKTPKSATAYVYIAASENVSMNMKGNDLVLKVGAEEVIIKTDTQSRAVLTGLPSGQKLCISMFAFNPAGSSSLTDEQSVIPQ